MTVAALGMTVAAAANAQTPSPLTYSVRQLHCARFAETSRSEIETETGRGAVKATAKRSSVWSFRAHDTTGGLVLEGWYDSLSLRRRTGEAELSPDTDGLIGGRYRGVLAPAGEYTETAHPFVPDEVAEVADLSGVARDLFPPLPPSALATGQSWKGDKTELTRLADTAVAGRPLLRFQLRSRSRTDSALARGDTAAIPVRQTTTEQGVVYWSPVSGLVRRTREITVEATIPSGGRVRQAARSRVTQHVELTRLPSQPACK